MSDLISRQAAIDAVEQAIINHDSAIMRITNLPSAEPPYQYGKPFLWQRGERGRPQDRANYFQKGASDE